MKRIVLCSDGTGNSAGKNRGTNVWKLYEAVDLRGHRLDPDLPRQVAFYDDGVGTENLKLFRVVGGALGLGLTRNVRELYKQLCRAYEPGDEIYLFGFSRGAYTVRTLAGMIAKCGVIRSQSLSDEQLGNRTREAFACFRLATFSTAYWNWLKVLTRFVTRQRKPDAAWARSFRLAHSHVDARHAPDGQMKVEFVGVFDTVDALGLPFDHATTLISKFVWPYKFEDRRLSPLVQKGCHAIAIDDERHTFHPVMWDADVEHRDRVEQVWFAGMHSNVGGGYPKQGMSLVALEWMMDQARAAGSGLRLIDAVIEDWRNHANVDDMMYNSRSGLAAYYRQNVRDIARICKNHGIDEPRIHVSVFERIALGTQDYSPANLPKRFSIVPYDASNPAPGEDAATLSALGVRLAATAPGQATLVLERVRGPVLLRRVAHYAFLTLTVAVLLGALALGPGRQPTSGPLVWVEQVTRASIAWLPFSEVIFARVLAPLVRRPEIIGIVASLLGLFYFVGLFARRRTARAASEYWTRALRGRSWRGLALQDVAGRARSPARRRDGPAP